jgi:NADH-quinone oxidoreductase subunit N
MSIGALALLAYLNSDARPVRSIDDLAGLGQSQPTVAFLLAVLLLSFIGLPLTAGFAGKLLLFLSAMAAPPTTPLQELFRVLALIGAINAAIASFYYLRVIMALYLRTPLQPVQPSRSVLLLVVGIICVIMTLGFGIYPWPLIQSTRWAAFSL